MLKKAKKFEKDKTPVSSEITEEEKSLLISGAVSKDEKTIIGERITIEGRIHGQEHLIIHGSMKGAIELEKHNSDIGSEGRFEGEIHARMALISRGQSSWSENPTGSQRRQKKQKRQVPLNRIKNQRTSRKITPKKGIDSWKIPPPHFRTPQTIYFTLLNTPA